MKVQIREGIVLAYGKALEGDDVYQAPDDYCPEKYTHTLTNIVDTTQQWTFKYDKQQEND
jgi:hypothetical protein